MRHEDWAPRLNEYLAKVQSNEFVMGEHDCCTFAAGALEVMLGTDYMEEFRGQYDTWVNSDQALEKIGAGDLFETIKAKFGEPLAGVYGRKGDLAFYEGSLGLVLGARAIFLGEKGLAYVKLTRLSHIFRVPE